MSLVMSDSKQIWVVVEIQDGAMKAASQEAINAARQLAEPVGGRLTAVVCAGPDATLPPELETSGIDRIEVLQHTSFVPFNSNAWLTGLLEAFRKAAPDLVVLVATNHGKELAPALAAALGSGLATDCVELKFEGDDLIAVRPVYAGKALSTVRLPHGKTHVVSLRPNVFRMDDTSASASAEVQRVDVALADNSLLLKIKEVVMETGDIPDLTEARIVVSGGMGMQSAENFSLLQDLARVLGAAVGASRPVVDDGWRPYSNQVGQTGRTVSPDLYIACGISGQVQHLAGMSSSRCIVAINTDPNAPIFDVADYGIVGDVLEILPALTAEFKKVLGK